MDGRPRPAGIQQIAPPPGPPTAAASPYGLPRSPAAPNRGVAAGAGGSLASEPRRAGRWRRRALGTGLGLSLALHALVALIAAAWVLRFDIGGASPTDGGEVEVALLTRSELAAMTAGDLQTTNDLPPSDLESQQPELSLPSDALASADAGLTESLDAVEVDVGGGNLDPGGLQTSGGGGIAGVSFFGIEAQGNRFAYIVDISSSMEGERMEATKRELTRSVQSLPESAEFVVVLYSDGAVPLHGETAWRPASGAEKRKASALISGIDPNGGTRPQPAFDEIFGLRVKPDAVYFMTDGEFDAEVPAAVAELNRRARVPIHCILFGDVAKGEAVRERVRDMMREISRRSGGRFNHVGGTP